MLAPLSSCTALLWSPLVGTVSPPVVQLQCSYITFSIIITTTTLGTAVSLSTRKERYRDIADRAPSFINPKSRGSCREYQSHQGDWLFCAESLGPRPSSFSRASGPFKCASCANSCLGPADPARAGPSVPVTEPVPSLGRPRRGEGPGLQPSRTHHRLRPRGVAALNRVPGAPSGAPDAQEPKAS